MNIKRLKQAEKAFFERYPGGFANPEMVAIRRVHRLDKMVELAKESFTKRNFTLPDLVLENMVKVVTRSSLISRFEKPRFRDFARSLLPSDRQILAKGLEEFLHGEQQFGFETLRTILNTDHLARWSLMTILPAYYRPDAEVFVKPTTAKGIIRTFELQNLDYQPAPTWAFYEKYRAAINEIKTKVDPSLSPYNIAFTGFLMRSIRGDFERGYGSTSMDKPR